LVEAFRGVEPLDETLAKHCRPASTCVRPSSGCRSVRAARVISSHRQQVDIPHGERFCRSSSHPRAVEEPKRLSRAAAAATCRDSRTSGFRPGAPCRRASRARPSDDPPCATRTRWSRRPRSRHGTAGGGGGVGSSFRGGASAPKARADQRVSR
jgi:hypothetical protein